MADDVTEGKFVVSQSERLPSLVLGLHLLRLRLKHQLAGLRRDPQNPLGRQVGSELLPALHEGIVEVLEEDGSKDNVLVLASVHRFTQLVRCLSQGVLEAEWLTVPAPPHHQECPPELKKSPVRPVC